MVDPAWVPIRHLRNNDGSSGCGGVGMYAVRRYRAADTFAADNFRLLDGSTTDSDGEPVCGACGRGMSGAKGWAFIDDAVAQVMVGEASG